MSKAQSFGLAILLIGLFYPKASPASDQSQGSGLTPEERQRFMLAAMRSIPAGEPDKSLSPYFFVLSDDPDNDKLPLKASYTDVQIAGVIARVKVTQVYKNEGQNTLEAVYIFPASTKAAVYAMQMTIGEKVIIAKVKEREQARKDYERARQEGRTASLLEQQRPNVFQMNVANILPNDEIKVEFKYTELLTPENNIYEFVYPTVVAPRYSMSGKQGEGREVENPYLSEQSGSGFTFGLKAGIRSGIPIAKIESPSHEISLGYTGPNTARVQLKEGKDHANRDFILRYSLAGNKIESGLLLYPGEDENFFLMMMEPPDRITQKDIVPREYIFIVDVSGSMNGFPIETSKTLLRDLISNLTADEFFNVILFAGGSDMLADKSVLATKDNIDKAIKVIEGRHGSGGTNLLPPLKNALEMPRREGTSRIIVVATDGLVNFELSAFELIRDKLGEANLFPFGIGSSINRHLIEGMARAGLGEPFVVTDAREASKRAAEFREYISAPLMQGIEVTMEDFDAYDIEPKSIPDLFAQRPLTIFGKYKGTVQGALVVSGHVPGQQLEGRKQLSEANISKDNEALRYLWARSRISRLSDMNKLRKSDPRVKEITELGLKYNLMTKYTSFIAEDTEVRADGTRRTVQQPVSTPSGMRRPVPRQYSHAPSGSAQDFSGTAEFSMLEAEGITDEFELASVHSRTAPYNFALNLDLFTMTMSSDDGAINHFAEIDFLFMWPLQKYWNPYIGLGMGLFAPRARLGVDIHPFNRFDSSLMLKLGGRFTFLTWVADTPKDFENFDAEYDFAYGFMGEVGVGWRFRFSSWYLQVLAVYLVGPMYPTSGGDDREFGEVEPEGSALFMGGTLSLAFEW